MKRHIEAVLIAACALAGIVIDSKVNGYAKLYPPEIPTVNIPIGARQPNWVVGSVTNGSCTWASLIPLLRWSSEADLAASVRRRAGGGEFMSEWPFKLDRLGVRYAMSKGGDVDFLKWAIRTRRGAAVGIHPSRKSTYPSPKHMVILAHLDGKRAIIIDPNNPRVSEPWNREAFIDEWKRAGGYAFVPVYTPAAPLP